MAELIPESYVPGRWVAVTTHAQVLLVDLAPEDPIVRRCWKLMSEESGVDTVLDALAAAGIGGAPGFALASSDAAGVRLVVRHPATVNLQFDDGDSRLVTARPDASWTDDLVAAGVDSFTLSGPVGESSVELPLGRGVTVAAAVNVNTGVDGRRDTPEPRIEGPPAPPSTPEAESQASEPADVEPEISAPSLSELARDAVDNTGLPSYDFLFGATQRPDDPPNLPVTPSRPQPGPSSAYTATWQSSDMDATPHASVEPGALIDAVPWAEPAPSHRVPDEAVEDHGATVNRAQVRAAASTGATGPVVLAGWCQAGHLSPPHAARCRVCGGAMPQQQAFEIVRPALGILRLADGGVVTLDRGVVLGRAPELPSGDGPDRPHVVKLPSPENDISRNHAEIILDGWNVYIRDFGSVNGTVIVLPGREPEKLREHDARLLENGTAIVLADELTLTFEVLA